MIRVLCIAASIAFVEGSPEGHAEPAGQREAVLSPSGEGPVSSPRLRYRPEATGAPARVILQGLAVDSSVRKFVNELSQQDWQQIFPVSVFDEDELPEAETIPMAGEYEWEGETVQFEPLFGFEPGVSFQAAFRFSKFVLRLKRRGGKNLTDYSSLQPMVLKFGGARLDQVPVTKVESVFPSRAVLPENLLKFYLHFSRPMSLGTRHQHIHLFRENGSEVVAPFLQLDEELWDPEGRRMTLLIDPGRVKSGLLPRDEVGPALEEGKEFRLVVDAAWPDAEGLPLVASFSKQFRVVAPDTESPRVSAWNLKLPMSRTRDDLVVLFPEPLDHALLTRVLWVEDSAGRVIKGITRVTDAEKSWRLSPDQDWLPGIYRLCVENSLEDLAGNSLGKLFEVDSFLTVSRRVERETIKRPFQLR